MLDAVIIGGGVVGGMIARALAVYDLKTAILEKEGDVAMGATRANSAIVHAGFDAKEGSLKALLNVRGAEMMEDVAKALDVPYQRNGSLVVGFSDTDRDHLLSLCERGKRNGVKGLCVLEKEDLLKIEPGVGEGVSCALYAPTGAIVCPYELAIAAIGNAMDNGASLYLRFAVTAIMAIEGGYRITAADGRAVEAKNVINCAGLYADDIARMVGDDSFSIHPRRGEYMLLDKECGALCEKTIFRCPTKMGKGILVSPTVDGNLLLGPTAEDGEDKEDRCTTSRGLASVFAAAKEQVANLPNGKSITSFAGLRAVGSTGDFIIGSPKKGFYNVAGIESPGLSASPAIAEYLVEMLKKDGLSLVPKQNVIATRTSPHAFRRLSAEEKNALIRKDSRYAKTICRCEGVTEGEIVAAIHQNPKPSDLDGIKRRTRAQMGRCQGGFCSPYIVELLSRELGIPYEKVTKFGGESYVNFERISKGGTDHEN